MNIRSIPLLVAFLSISTIPFAQNKADHVQVKWSEMRTAKEHGDLRAVLNVSHDLIFILVDLNGSTQIQVFDHEMKMLKQIDVGSEGKNKYIWEDCLFRKDRMLVFTSQYEKKSKTLFARVYTLPDLLPLSTAVKLLTGSADDKDDQYAFIIGDHLPGDGFHVYTKTSKGYEGPSKIFLFDAELQAQGEAPEHSIKDAVPLDKNEYEFEDSQKMPDGSRYIVVRKYPEKSEKRRRKREGDPAYDMVLVHQGPNGGAGGMTDLSISDKFLQDLKMLEQENGDIVCAGFWGNKNSWEIRGAFFIRIDHISKEVAQKSFFEFDDGLITQYMSGRELREASRSNSKGEDMEMADYHLRELVPRHDGGSVLVAEQYVHDIIEHTNSNGVTKYVNTYLYRDILVVSIDANGTIQWGAKIPKLQYSKDDDGRYSSYVMMLEGEQVHFLFNDNLKNLSLKTGDKIQLFKTAGSEAVITLATVDPKGNVHREALVEPHERGTVLIPENCLEHGDGRLIIHGVDGRDYKFGSIRCM